MSRLRLYSRAGCHLCDDFQQQLTPLAAELGLDCQVLDVDERPEWRQLYGQRVPVLLLDGEPVCQYFLDAAALRAAAAARM